MRKRLSPFSFLAMGIQIGTEAHSIRPKNQGKNTFRSTTLQPQAKQSHKSHITSTSRAHLAIEIRFESVRRPWGRNYQCDRAERITKNHPTPPA